ncbi:hypothetical protein OPQ81_000642 [Rhizoctonia solani]|nr:hypothetical protein OPQ81_000642 [Rhizoctonia solani]
MKSVFDFKQDRGARSDDALVARNISLEFAQRIQVQNLRDQARELSAAVKSAETKYQFQKRNSEFAKFVFLQLALGVASFAASVYCVVKGTKAAERLGFGRENDSEARQVQFIDVPCFVKARIIMDEKLFSEEMADECESTISSIHRALQKQEAPDTSTKLTVLDLLLDKTTWEYSLLKCVNSQINQTARAHIKDPQTRLDSHTLHINKGGGQALSVSVEDFHEYNHERIRAHATRVGQAGLGTAELVEIDIKIAMEEVWEALPGGYGGRFMQAS